MSIDLNIKSKSDLLDLIQNKLFHYYNQYNQNSKIGQLQDYMSTSYSFPFSFFLFFFRFSDPQLKKINVEFAGVMGVNVKHEEGYLTGDLSQN